MLWAPCFSFSEGAPLDFSDMFWVQFSSFNSLVFLVPRFFAMFLPALVFYFIFSSFMRAHAQAMNEYREGAMSSDAAHRTPKHVDGNFFDRRRR